MIGSKKNVDIWEHASKKTNNKNKNNIFLLEKICGKEAPRTP